MTIRWTRLAVADLDAAVDYVATDDPEAALALYLRVTEAVETLADGRFDGPAAKLTTGGVVRRWVIPPFAIFYDRDDDGLIVLRVYDGRRAPITR